MKTIKRFKFLVFPENEVVWRKVGKPFNGNNENEVESVPNKWEEE